MDTLPLNFDYKKAKIEKRMRRANFKDFSVNRDLSVDINGHDCVYFKRLDFDIAIRINRVRSFDTGMYAVESFENFPTIISEDLRIEAARSLQGIHKYVKYIGGNIHLGRPKTNSYLPSHLLNLALINGPFKLVTSDFKFNTLFNEQRQCKDILLIQDKLIEAGFVEQARL